MGLLRLSCAMSLSSEARLPSGPRPPSCSKSPKRRTALERAAPSTRLQPLSPGLSSSTEHNSRCVRRSEEHTSELQSRLHLVCRLLLEKKNKKKHKFKACSNI